VGRAHTSEGRPTEVPISLKRLLSDHFAHDQPPTLRI